MKNVLSTSGLTGIKASNKDFEQSELKATAAHQRLLFEGIIILAYLLGKSVAKCRGSWVWENDVGKKGTEKNDKAK